MIRPQREAAVAAAGVVEVVGEDSLEEEADTASEFEKVGIGFFAFRKTGGPALL